MIAGVIVGAGRGGREGREGLERCGRRDGSWRWGCAGSQGPGDDEPGGAGEEPRCSAWLMSKTIWISFVFSVFVPHVLFTSV